MGMKEHVGGCLLVKGRESSVSHIWGNDQGAEVQGLRKHG